MIEYEIQNIPFAWYNHLCMLSIFNAAYKGARKQKVDTFYKYQLGGIA